MRFISPTIFTPTKSIKAQILTVGHENHKIVTVDNFYQKPYEVRSFFRNSPAPQYKAIRQSPSNFRDFYDCRHSIQITEGLEDLTNTLHLIVQETYQKRLFFNCQIVSNIFQLIKPQPLNTTAQPHIDWLPDLKPSFQVNALVYLNTNSESRGGTFLYRHIKSGLESIPLENKPYKNFLKNHLKSSKKTPFWNKYQKVWLPFHLLEMKFNRLVIFPSQVFHGAWHQPNWFSTYPRITQVFFTKNTTRSHKKRG